MALANRCYVRKGLQDPNEPTKCLDVDQPAKVTSSDQFGNKWYDFNADYDKKGLKISDTECEDLTTDDYNRTDIDNVDKNFDLTDYNKVDINGDDLVAREYIRRGLQDPDTGKTSYITDTCPPTITFTKPTGGDDVMITDFAIITENRLIIVAEQDNDIYFEPDPSTTTDNYIIL